MTPYDWLVVVVCRWISTHTILTGPGAGDPRQREQRAMPGMEIETRG